MLYHHTAVKRAAPSVRVDELVIRPRDFAANLGDWFLAAGLLTLAVLITMAPFVLL